MGMNGADVLVLIDGNVVGSQRDCTFEETDDGVDYSSKDSRARRVGCGRYGSTVSLDGLYVPSDAAYQALQSAIRVGTLVVLRRQEAGAAIEEADVRVDSLSDKDPDQEECTISAKFTIDGQWVELAT